MRATHRRRSARRSARRASGALVALAFVAAACSGGDSALEAGLDDEPEPTTGSADEPDAESDDDTSEPEVMAEADSADASDGGEGSTDSDPDDGSGDDGSGDEAGDGTGSTEAEAPQPELIAELAPCPVDALAEADGPVELTMWFGLAEQLAGELEALTDEFNASQDQVVVNLENQTDYETTIDNVLNLSAANRPSLALLPEFVVQTFAESGEFVPAESCIAESGLDTSTFLDRALVAYSYGDVQWGMPFNLSSPVLYYNKVVFEAAGLDPDDPPESFAELREVSEAIVTSGAASFGEVVDVSRDGAGARIEQWFGQREEAFVDSGNGREGRATEALFGTETGLEVMLHLRDMRRDGLSVNVGENAGGLDAFLKLIDASEPGAMTVATSAAIVQVIEALGGGLAPGLTTDDIGVGFLPGPDGTIAAQVGGASLWITAGRPDAEVAAAWSYIDFLVSAQSQSTWAAGTGYVPMRSDALDLEPLLTLYEQDPRFRVSYDQLTAPIGSIDAARPALGPQREVRQVISEVIATIYQDPTIDDAAVQALLDDAVEQSNTLIETYNRLN